MTQNSVFVVGQTLTSTEVNLLPFGVCNYSSSTTNYVLTATLTIATDMTTTFTAVADRLYKITYYEPQAGITSALSGYTVLQIRETSAVGTQLQSGIAQNQAAVSSSASINVVHVGTFTAGSVTVVGCASTSSVTGAPTLTRSATSVARFLVEDIGPS